MVLELFITHKVKYVIQDTGEKIIFTDSVICLTIIMQEKNKLI